MAIVSHTGGNVKRARETPRVWETPSARHDPAQRQNKVTYNSYPLTYF